MKGLSGASRDREGPTASRPEAQHFAGMVERVTRAIAIKLFGTARVHDDGLLEETARAAIAAMREPTETMIEAAYDEKALKAAYPNMIGADLHDFGAHDCAPGVWSAMIDAALDDAPGNPPPSPSRETTG